MNTRRTQVDESAGNDAIRLIDLPRVNDPRGNLTFVESGQHVPFEIKRIYYLYDVPGGAARGGHAHRTCQGLILALAGSFDVVLERRGVRVEHSLNRSYYGLYVPAMTWREVKNFSSGSVSLVLASEHYDEADYIRDYNVFQRLSGE